MRFDLHCHTRHSDGDKTVEEILSLAVKRGLSGISITDHDTIDAYQEIGSFALSCDLKWVSGIEISCLHHKKSVHVLAYSFSLEDPSFIDFVQKCQNLRQQRNLTMIERFKSQNIDLSRAFLEEKFAQPIHKLGRPHFAKSLVDLKISKNFQDAFNRYLADGKVCYVIGERPSVEETIDLIHQANALAVLAHPHLIADASLVQDLLKMNWDGLECYYAKMHPHQEKKWIDLAQKKGWLATGGSDFHGKSKPMNPLGCSWVAQDTFEILHARYLENVDLR